MRDSYYLRIFTKPGFYIIKIVVFILLITVVIRPNSSFAQEQTIDRLKKVLPGLRDTGRVDCLNAIGQQYFIMSQIDSATRFVQLAYEESRQLNYIQTYRNTSNMLRH
jgi:hypothetical protein